VFRQYPCPERLELAEHEVRVWRERRRTLAALIGLE
jgi:hypothetical protein